MISTKQKLYALCQDYLVKRIETTRYAIESLQLSANEETKSSAGDKYETGRSMMQFEMEKHGAQLADCLKLKNTLDSIKIDRQHQIAQLGSLVIMDHGNFFLSISAGKLSLDDKIYIAISTSSPIGIKLLGLRIADTFSFNNQAYKILDIC